MTHFKQNSLFAALILGYVLLGVHEPLVLPLGLLLVTVIALKPYIVSIFDRVALGISLLLCLNILAGLAAWLIGLSFSPQVVFLTHGIIALAITGYIWHKNNSLVLCPPLKPPVITSSEILSLLASVGILLVLLVPLLTKYDTNYIFQYFVFGGDNTAHLEFTNVVDANAGYVYEDVSATKNVITTNSTAYPQGLALNMYIAREYIGTLVTVDTPKRTLYTFILMSAVLYALLGYVWIRTAFALTSKIGRSTMAVQILTFLIAIVVFLGGFLHFHTNGFQTHIVSLILFGQILFLATLLLGTSRRADKFLIYISFVLNIGIAFTWLFLAPVSLLIATILLLKVFGDRIFTRRAPVLFRFLKENYLMVIAIMVAITACLVQVYVQLAYGIKDDSVNESGYIIRPEQSLILLGAIVPLVLYATTIRQHSSKAESPFFALMVFCVVSALFTTAIYLYQVLTEGRPEYYYFKTAYHLILLGAVSTPALILLLLKSTQGRLSQFVICTGFVVVFIVGTLTMPRHLTPIVNGTVSNISPELANAYGDIVNTEPQNANNIVSIGSCNRQQDFVITKLSGILGNDNTYLRQRLAFSIITNTRDLPKLVSDYNQVLRKTNERLIILNNGFAPRGVNEATIAGAAFSAVSPSTDLPDPQYCPHKFTGEGEPKNDDFRAAF